MFREINELVAYLVSSNDKKDTSALRHAIEEQLPDYMMPSAFMWLDDFPKPPVVK